MSYVANTSVIKSKTHANGTKNYWNTDEMSKLVTPYQTKRLPVYRWCSYKHSFSRNLVHHIIDKYGLTEDEKILDPFCGAGTTLLAAKERGISSIGTDLMPLSVLASNVKVQKYEKYSMLNLLENFRKESITIRSDGSYQNFSYIEKYFPKGSFEIITSLKESIRQIDEAKFRDFFLLGLLGILEEVSYTKKDGAFLRTVVKDSIKPVREAFFEKLDSMVSDLDFLNRLPNVYSKAILSDARETKIASSSINAVITSPPYPNRHDYTRIYLLELMVGFIDDYKDVKKLRYNLLRSHVEAREKYSSSDYVVQPKLEKVLSELKSKNLPNRNVINLVDGYFKDMHLFLKEMKRVLVPGGTLHIVIGDARYGGINIYAGNYIVELAKDLGFEHIETVKARDKGNSPQQMGKYGKSYSLESIICLQK